MISPRTLTSSFRRFFGRWAARRCPKAPTVRLQHKSIYVLPTRQGLLFIFVLAVMWLLGTNYQNNLVLATTFLLLGVMCISILHTFKNLSGLRFTAIGCRPVFAGEYASFEVLVEPAAKSSHENVIVSFEDHVSLAVDLAQGSEQRLHLSTKTHRRGWFEPERLLVKTIYPLGLFRAWSWIQLDMKTLVYPSPLPSALPPVKPQSSHQGELSSPENNEDFQGFSRYQNGAPLTHIAWKKFARGAGLYLKDYTGYQSQQVWLDWDSLAGLDVETRLSQLCYWAVELAKTRSEFGLRLPDCVIDLGSGSAHQEQVLRALALYGLKTPSVQGVRYA